MVFEQVQRQGREGLYNFAFSTRPQDPTGNWRAQILIGGQHLRSRAESRDRRPLPAQDRNHHRQGAPGPGRRDS